MRKADPKLRAIAKLDEIPDFAAITECQDQVVPVRILDDIPLWSKKASARFGSRNTPS